ncbi:hypothetical protein B0T24DRAFT_515081 [Lasiosphaeria ovina]|uniref:Aminoglycoside phosphotransferase domain-containing protein n=1 Tax=Lasiosphaeria ovina TaxID=92902 RepID=A0AAE0NN10_9PEZI|nr:hypothetical protein B0T24DRAFT_515081 [Lasiosphaeria ovina]
MAALGTSRVPPSTQWTSFAGWDYNGMKERLQRLLAKIDKSVLTRHAQSIKGQKVTMSQPFSAGQYWICFEMIAEDGSLVIARVRLPRHPDTPPTISEEDEQYSIACEVATMAFVRQNVPAITLPQIYTYEGPGSQLAADAGAIYMLLEGFYGNTLQDIEPDLCNLSTAIQEHIITQWTRVQVELATLAYPQIGSISSVSTTGEPVIGRLASASAEGLRCHGPFSSTAEYFTAVADAAISKLDLTDTDSNGVLSFTILGAFVFRDIVQNTTLFEDGSAEGRFPLNHMDLGTQNILVDDKFNFRAIIDWEFAQTAPWQVNHYPMPFPLLESDMEIQGILQDPNHPAHGNVSRQESARRLYTKKFRDAEVELRKIGRSLGSSFAEVLDSPASRIYACFTKLGRLPMADAGLVHEMVRLAFDLDAEGTERYLHVIGDRLKRADNKAR